MLNFLLLIYYSPIPLSPHPTRGRTGINMKVSTEQMALNIRQVRLRVDSHYDFEIFSPNPSCALMVLDILFKREKQFLIMCKEAYNTKFTRLLPELLFIFSLLCRFLELLIFKLRVCTSRVNISP